MGELNDIFYDTYEEFKCMKGEKIELKKEDLNNIQITTNMSEKPKLYGYSYKSKDVKE